MPDDDRHEISALLESIRTQNYQQALKLLQNKLANTSMLSSLQENLLYNSLVNKLNQSAAPDNTYTAPNNPDAT